MGRITVLVRYLHVEILSKIKKKLQQWVKIDLVLLVLMSETTHIINLSSASASKTSQARVQQKKYCCCPEQLW